MTIMDAIRRRHSVRTYSGAPLTEEQWEQLEAELARLQVLYGVKLALLKNEYEGRQFGSYGMIKNPAAYIAAACEPGALVRCGEAMEVAVLRCEALGLGTCWLGGAFNRGEFSSKLAAGEAELIPAVISVGRERAKPRLVDGLIRTVAKSDRRLPFGALFFDGAFGVPLRQGEAPECVALEMVRLGPSASNKQPWRVVRAGGAFHFYEQHAPGYQKMPYDMQALDMGIAKAHFALSMDELGKKGAWQVADPRIAGQPDGCAYVGSWIEEN